MIKIMKKGLMMLGVAAMVLASCTQNEVVEVAENRTIGFDAFVGNTTKADITDATISEFYVYGGYDGLVNVFNNVKVYKKGEAWTYDNTQYWTAGKTYKFQGYAPATNTAAAGDNGVNFTDFVADGETDLLASAVESVTIPEEFTVADPVGLTFRHVLSKIKFKFTTNLDNVDITISGLKVNKLPNTGTYTNNGTTGTWVPAGEGDYPLTSDGTLVNKQSEGKTTALESSEAIVLPQTPNEIEVTFTLNATGGLTLENKSLTVKLPNTKLEEGNVYVYTAQITAQNIDPDGELVPIIFDVPTVTPWNPETPGGDVSFE